MSPFLVLMLIITSPCGTLGEIDGMLVGLLLTIGLFGLFKFIFSFLLVGEIEQAEDIHKKQVSILRYLRRISGKTASLFSFSFFLGGYESGVDQNIQKILYSAGYAFGMSFQIIDDILDYSRIEAGKLHIEIAPFNIHEVIKDVLSLFSVNVKEKGIRIQTEMDITGLMQLM